MLGTPQKIYINLKVKDENNNFLFYLSNNEPISTETPLGLHSEYLPNYKVTDEYFYSKSRTKIRLLVFSFVKNIQICGKQDIISSRLHIPTPEIFKWFLDKNNIQLSKNKLNSYIITYDKIKKGIKCV